MHDIFVLTRKKYHIQKGKRIERLTNNKVVFIVVQGDKTTGSSSVNR